MLTLQQAAQVFDQFYKAQTVFPAEPQNLYEPCEYALASEGKRIRPVLCLMGYELFKPNITDDVFHTALSFEMFHNFTLIHDDIMDNSPVRRGKPSVFKKFGSVAAILSGDVMNICAYETLGKVKDDAALVKLLRLFNKTAKEICEGQQLDMDFETQEEVSLEDYIKMINLKTSILLAACLKAGGILGGASEANQQSLYEYGINLGTAFQIQDDYLDTFGTEQTIGKLPGGDIRCNKKTALMILLKSALTTQFDTIYTPLIQLSDSNKVEAVKALYTQHGIDVQTQQLVAKYTQMAHDCLTQIDVAPEQKIALTELTNYLLLRKN